MEAQDCGVLGMVKEGCNCADKGGGGDPNVI